MKKTILTCAAVASIILFACKKEDVAVIDTIITTPAKDTTGVTSVSNDAMANNLFESAQKTIDEGMETADPSAKLSSTYGGCATVEKTATLTSITFTYTFSGTCTDGKKRSGSITISCNKLLFRAKDAQWTIQMNDYSVDGYKISGRKVVTNLADINLSNGFY